MKYLYIPGCFLIALFLPHLTAESVNTVMQVILQIAFVFAGVIGFCTFND